MREDFEETLALKLLRRLPAHKVLLVVQKQRSLSDVGSSLPRLWVDPRGVLLRAEQDRTGA